MAIYEKMYFLTILYKIICVLLFLIGKLIKRSKGRTFNLIFQSYQIKNLMKNEHTLTTGWVTEIYLQKMLKAKMNILEKNIRKENLMIFRQECEIVLLPTSLLPIFC